MNHAVKSLRSVLFAMTAVLTTAAFPAWSQTTQPSAASSLLSLIPGDAFFYVERQGHARISAAFEASNVGEMARDETIAQFVNDSRVKIGQMIVRELFDLQTPEEIEKHEQILHQFLLPFWHNPSAMFAVLSGGKMHDAPAAGFIVVMDKKYGPDAEKALATLMKIGVPADGTAGTRQAFTYKSGLATWQGVAKDRQPFTLPAKAEDLPGALKSKSLFLVYNQYPILCVATDLAAADALSKTLVDPKKSLENSESFKAVMKKTAMKDWAFRWFLDSQKLQKAAAGEDGGRALATLATLGVDAVRGVGGTGGYMDNVYARLTYVDAPGAKGGLTKLFKAGGSYKKAVAMMPGEPVFCLAGQLDKTAVMNLVRGIAKAAHGGVSEGTDVRTHRSEAIQEEQVQTLDEEGDSFPALKARASAPSTAPAAGPVRVEETIEFNADDSQKGAAEPDQAELAQVVVKKKQVLVDYDPTTAPAASEDRPATGPASRPSAGGSGAEEAMKQVEALLDASDGNVAVYVTDLQSVATGMMGGAGMPVAAVLDIKDAEKAAKAVDAIAEMIGGPGGEDAGGTAPPGAAPSKEYRKIAIRNVHTMLRIAVLKDRVIFAMGEDALKAGIDVALDKMGGLPAGGKAEKLARFAGDGPAFFMMDLAAIAKLGWPFLSQMQGMAGENFPLASLPSGLKLVSLLGPEVVVFQPDEAGLLLKSRGKIPFATKFLLYFVPMFGMMM
jgi:hypothetical protein